MKKGFLLGIIPALLALSACNGALQPKEESNLFLEDTLAHDEIFDCEDNFKRVLAPQKLATDDPIAHPDTDIFVGYQAQSEGTGLMSFRFVAALRFEEGQLDPTQAIWTRTVSYTNGTAKMAKANKECTKAYLSLSAGAGYYSIDNFNADHELTGSNACTHFVVYTLRNVPVDENDYYISAYLTLSNKEGQSGGKTLDDSKAIAVNASQTQKYVYYPKDLGNGLAAGMYFIEGSIKGQNTIKVATAIRYAGDKAQFEFVDFDANDTFVIKEFYDTELIIHGYSECFNNNTSRAATYFEEGANDTIKAKTAGNYGVYLHNDNQMAIGGNDPYDIHNGYFIKGSMNSWSEDANCEMYSSRTNNAVTHSFHLNANDLFKVWKKSGDVNYGWPSGKRINPESEEGDFTAVDDGFGGLNVKCLRDGEYIIYLNGNNEIWVHRA